MRDKLKYKKEDFSEAVRQVLTDNELKQKYRKRVAQRLRKWRKDGYTPLEAKVSKQSPFRKILETAKFGIIEDMALELLVENKLVEWEIKGEWKKKRKRIEVKGSCPHCDVAFIIERPYNKRLHSLFATCGSCREEFVINYHKEEK